MKISRHQLKALIKECLREILNEGLGDVSSMKPTVESVRPRPRQKSGSLDQPIVSKPTEALKHAVVMESGGNPTLAAILADTATTTLPKMLAGDRPGTVPQGGGAVELAVANSTPEELFGEESASRWANLAFDSPSPKR